MIAAYLIYSLRITSAEGLKRFIEIRTKNNNNNIEDYYSNSQIRVLNYYELSLQKTPQFSCLLLLSKLSIFISSDFSFSRLLFYFKKIFFI